MATVRDNQTIQSDVEIKPVQEKDLNLRRQQQLQQQQALQRQQQSQGISLAGAVPSAVPMPANVITSAVTGLVNGAKREVAVNNIVNAVGTLASGRTRADAYALYDYQDFIETHKKELGQEIVSDHDNPNAPIETNGQALGAVYNKLFDADVDVMADTAKGASALETGSRVDQHQRQQNFDAALELCQKYGIDAPYDPTLADEGLTEFLGDRLAVNQKQGSIQLARSTTPWSERSKSDQASLLAKATTLQSTYDASVERVRQNQAEAHQNQADQGLSY